MHPIYLVDDEIWDVVRLWQLWRPSGFGGYGQLPFSGGAADQPVVLLEAFAHCGRISVLAREREQRRGRHDSD